ncbi:MAG: TlpA family protein disulfide reductase [Chloroflexi bacterium]|nr:TlpA family protein disulfide reductase [Chloroflexota bacterium]
MALTVAVYILYVAGLPEESEQPVGPIRPFTAVTIQGGTITIDESFDRPVILNFWATWCVPCVVEMPHLQQVYDDFRGEGLVVVGINAGQEDVRDAAAFVINQKITFPIVIDKNRIIEQLYEVRGVLPTTVFIDEQGNIQKIVYGILTEDNLSEGLSIIGLNG